MCGICGRLASAGCDREQLERMAAAIAHRGPDDEGIHLEGSLGLAVKRLSIIDVEGGRQPVANEDGTVRVVFNGEIYNFRELRKELEDRGHRFSTASDTEVIVHLYEELGEGCVARLRGMFAFALWDQARRQLVLARDRLGQKPLFYAHTDGDFIFASEIKAILAASPRARELDLESLHQYLSLRFVPSPRTMFRGIFKLPPGHLLVFRDGAARLASYWELDFRSKLELGEDELLEALEEALTGAVASHLVSDVPVGALLSGGMDSSTIVALMAEIVGQPFPTFSIGVREQTFDELPYARLVANHFGTTHLEQCAEADVIHLLPAIVGHLDEPSDPVAACMFHASRLASRHVKVALGGDGGDELFAGFDRYQGVDRMGYWGRRPTLALRAILRPLLAALPESFAYKSLTQKLRWFDRLAQIPDAGARYAEATLFFRFSHEQKRELFADSIWRQVAEIDSARVLIEQFERAPAFDPIDRMLYTDYSTRLPEHSLMLSDRMSMAHGLEVRAPLVDHQLVELLARFPSSLKIRGGELKYALRRLVEDRLPKKVLSRHKQGFMLPMAYWFERDLYPFLSGFLAEARTVADGILDGVSVRRLLEDHRQRKVDNHVRIWMLLNFEIWYRMYLAGEDRTSVEGLIDGLLHDLALEAAGRQTPGGRPGARR